MITVSGSDIEDDQGDFACSGCLKGFFEYRLSGQPTWEADSMVAPTNGVSGDAEWDSTNMYFHAYFLPAATLVLGWYEFRVTLTDKDDGMAQGISGDRVDVQNSPPEAVSIEPDSVLGGTAPYSSTSYIWVVGTDL